MCTGIYQFECSYPVEGYSIRICLYVDCTCSSKAHAIHVHAFAGGACGGLAVFVGGSDGKSLYNHVVTFDFNYNTSTPAGAGGDKHKYAVKHASAHARVGCLGDRFALISGGASGRDCVQTVSVLDTHHPPGDGAVLPVLATLGGSTGTLAVASLSNGEAVGFFDGVSIQLFTMGK